MGDYRVWSPHDGQPIPANNPADRDALLAQGYLPEPPDPAPAPEPEPQPPAS